MKCPVCEYLIPDEIANKTPCVRCGCMDLLTPEFRKLARVKKEEAGNITSMVRKEKK